MLRQGSTGDEVVQLQDRLRELGFDRRGEFGPATRAAVIAFQESRGLLPDGIVGPVTQAALEEDAQPVDEEAPSLIVVDRSRRLPSGNYFMESVPKDLIVLHHTVGASAQSTIDWWTSQDNRIATAYVIERDGTIHEVFDPRFWAHHLGVRGIGRRLDRRSIGIELACEGPLEKTSDGFRAFGRPFRGDVFDCGSPWRDSFRYFAAYTPQQTEATIDVVDHLCSVFGIPRRTPSNHLDFDSSLYEYRGVIGHHHVRRDKTDLHPGFDWPRLIEAAKLEST